MILCVVSATVALFASPMNDGETTSPIPITKEGTKRGNHIPTTAEFCERLAKSENFMNMLKEMKPWGDLDSIILKVRALTGKEEYEGTLRFIYKETI